MSFEYADKAISESVISERNMAQTVPDDHVCWWCACSVDEGMEISGFMRMGSATREDAIFFFGVCKYSIFAFSSP